MKFFRTTLLPLMLLISTFAFGQNKPATLRGIVISAEKLSAIPYAAISLKETDYHTLTDTNGIFTIHNISAGNYTLEIYSINFGTKAIPISLQAGDDQSIEIHLISNSKDLKTVTISAQKLQNTGIERMKGIDFDKVAIYEGKKSEVILLSAVNANFATNNCRQIFAKVPGINIIENDGAGIQLGLAVRGLNPNRISEFNSRQNGYDIAADALGYPESYYTPPAEGLEKIEVVRGAASLQYGSQFGGLLNFVMKKAPLDKKVEITSQQTVGSYGLINSFNSVGGTKGKLSYYGFFHHKQGNGWRENAGFNINTGFASFQYKATKKLTLGTEYTLMHYKMQQPGGLTDAQFKENARQATRSRNWFSATWFIPVVTADYKVSENTKINWRNFALVGSRSSLGNLIAPNQMDYKLNRTLMIDNYRNIGSELRLIHSYKLGKEKSTFLVGARYYRGNTHRRQGLGTDLADADFNFINPNDLEGSDFRFPSTNIAVFSENIFKISNRFTITPGLRWEMIETNANGYYKVENNVREEDNKSNRRSFPLAGLGLCYHTTETNNFYANFSQAYSGVNFNDIRVINPTFRVDPNLKDMNGYNFDFGYRGKIKSTFHFDIGGFYLRYNDRIGVLTKYDENYNTFRYRTNIADSRSMGVESYTELNISKLLNWQKGGQISVFNTTAFTDARYIKTPVKAVYNKKVEYAPTLMARLGLTYSIKRFSSTILHSFVSEQYTDATNTKFTPNAVNGVIPSYHLLDFSANYKYKKFNAGFSVNNICNAMYFTRRAEGYPGPGILPSDGRTFAVSLGVKL